jgi:hypothetical protein
MEHVPTEVAPDLRSRSYLIEALVDFIGGDRGVLITMVPTPWDWRRTKALVPLSDGDEGATVVRRAAASCSATTAISGKQVGEGTR